MVAYPDLAIVIRNALINGSGITDLLGVSAAGDSVYTSRPVPVGAKYPLIVVGPDMSPNDAGGLNDQRLVIMRDVGIYGQNSGDTKSQYRDVETVSRLVRDLFHRKPRSITATGWKVVQVWTRGPYPGPTSDDKFVARIVELTITLSAVL